MNNHVIFHKALALITCFIISVSVNAQYSTYSYKDFGLNINFPSTWQVLNQQQLNNALTASMNQEDKIDSTALEIMSQNSIITFAQNQSDTAPNYSIIVLTERFVKETAEMQIKDYLITGIRFMLQQGLQIPEFTIPIPYKSPKGIMFYSCEMKMIVNGSITYKKNFVTRRQNDFLIITGSYPTKNDNAWISKVVDSIVLTN